MARTAKGFSLVEMVVVMALIGIGSSIALIQMKNSIKIVDADEASNLVIGQLQYARQISVDQRKNVLVEFLGTNEIRVTRQNGGGATTVMADVRLPTGYTFSMPMGAADTPDGYGNANPVYFNNGTSGTFLADGIFVSGANILLNGSVFTMAGTSGTARAVTLTGASGRLVPYWLQGAVWTQE
jgi:prepilin-type N-terminal cleavage/methylation domain-containing protein